MQKRIHAGVVYKPVSDIFFQGGVIWIIGGGGGEVCVCDRRLWLYIQNLQFHIFFTKWTYFRPPDLPIPFSGVEFRARSDFEV